MPLDVAPPSAPKFQIKPNFTHWKNPPIKPHKSFSFIYDTSTQNSHLLLLLFGQKQADHPLPFFFFLSSHNPHFFILHQFPPPKTCFLLTQAWNLSRIHELFLLLVLLWLVRVSNMMIYGDYMICYGWLNMETFGLGWIDQNSRKDPNIMASVKTLKPIHTVKCTTSTVDREIWWNQFQMKLDIQSFLTI